MLQKKYISCARLLESVAPGAEQRGFARAFRPNE
jgi:hypothetical protein